MCANGCSSIGSIFHAEFFEQAFGIFSLGDKGSIVLLIHLEA